MVIQATQNQHVSTLTASTDSVPKLITSGQTASTPADRHTTPPPVDIPCADRREHRALGWCVRMMNAVALSLTRAFALECLARRCGFGGSVTIS